ncbi:hypothetical protein [Stutzerimonas stutzeri]|uniref:hypothetical protein n=1 Tax=Stutzerimonas stutzeri TaxID=316 RepID=UPI0011AF916D|nr:hypothetical protein [Stutzerimonas stutzeri]MCQ4265582.1 hypothetical protein [Stutzerimonas stutzeri]
MEEKLSTLEEISKEFETIGQELFEACKGQLFPADAILLASCNRALQVLHGFTLIVNNGGYSCGVALLRLQLDSVLRLYGITITKDPHDTANKIISGEKLSKIKDKTGEKLSDGYLVSLLAKQNPWLKHVYSLCSGYIHLSDASFHHLLKKSEPVPESNERGFYIGSDESEIEMKQRIELIQAFIVATKGIQEITTQWTASRDQFGLAKNLKKKYTQIA